MRKLIILFLLCCTLNLTAQTTQPEPITSDNIQQLQPVAQIDFADISNDFVTGWFVMNSTGDTYVIRDSAGQVYRVTYSTSGESYIETIDETEPNSLVDAIVLDESYIPLEINQGAVQINEKIIPIEDAIAIWRTNDSAIELYVETFEANNESAIAKVDLFSEEQPTVEMLPYAPARDDESVVRVGRIPLPYVVTSTLEGIVKLWNVQTDELLYAVDNETGEPSVFGNINTDATYFVWRDNRNESLYLLDFETGENRFIDNLNGQYAQWYFLSNDASVILAVDFDAQPVIVAWDITTGERYNLGNYRSCQRPQPDAAHLSDDGTTLVIGCDTGLDIWRINEGDN